MQKNEQESPACVCKSSSKGNRSSLIKTMVGMIAQEIWSQQQISEGTRLYVIKIMTGFCI